MASKDVMAPVARPRNARRDRARPIRRWHSRSSCCFSASANGRSSLGSFRAAGGPFEEMSTPWAIVTIHMAVVDLVAAVGLWMRVAGGKVIWVYSALFEVALHTGFISTFGTNWPVVGFHVVTLFVFFLLTFLARRQIRSLRQKDECFQAIGVHPVSRR